MFQTKHLHIIRILSNIAYNKKKDEKQYTFYIQYFPWCWRLRNRIKQHH
jgi:hypothetical protein